MRSCAGSFLSSPAQAHIFDRIIEELLLSVGAGIGYWRGNVKLLMEDVAALQPTIFVAVPRILERVAETGASAVVGGGGGGGCCGGCGGGQRWLWW